MRFKGKKEMNEKALRTEETPLVIMRPYLGKPIKAPEVIVRPIRERPLQVFSEEHLEAMPDYFSCFCCGESFPKKRLGGIEYGLRICCHCYPWIDGWTVGCMIKFDLNRSHPVQGYSCPKTPKMKDVFVPSQRVAQAMAKSAEETAKIENRIKMEANKNETRSDGSPVSGLSV